MPAAMRAPLAAVLALCSCASPAGEHVWPVVYEQSFASPAALDELAFSEPTKWCHRGPDAPHGPALELLGKSDYRPPHRSPHSIALVQDVEVRDFDLEVELLQNGRDYGHRDLCLFFGFASPSRFYYVHLATTPDPNAHNVFVVTDAPRTNLAPVAAAGIDWGRDRWHRVRIERRVDAGTIAVYWDDRPEPVLTATSDAIGWGRIGFGSFDDSGLMRNVVLRAPASRRPTSAPFGTGHR